jgi:hypothetical protein
MKDEITIPIPKEEDFTAANMRRDKYAITRDQQAQEYNRAIALRLQSEAKDLSVKCEKCGKQYAPGTDSKNGPICPDCE